MTFYAITATLNTLALEPVEKALQEIGVPGITVTETKGYGVYRNFYQRDWLETHARIQIYAEGSRVDDIVRTILEAASTGCEDDGVIAVSPITRLYRICDKTELTKVA